MFIWLVPHRNAKCCEGCISVPGQGRPGQAVREVAVWCGPCPGLEVGLQSPDLLRVSPSCKRSARISLLWERQPDSRPAVTGSTPREAVSSVLSPHSEPPTAKKDMDDSSVWLRSRDQQGQVAARGPEMQRSPLGAPSVGLVFLGHFPGLHLVTRHLDRGQYWARRVPGCFPDCTWGPL